jgi:probable rRNA maturation factor
MSAARKRAVKLPPKTLPKKRKALVRAPNKTARAPRPRSRLHFEVQDRGRPRTDLAFLRRVVRATLTYCKRLELPVSLLLTNDREIARLHAEYLDDPTPTDVISFDLDGEAELVISVETAKRMATVHGHALRAEVALYVVHGLLHTCGYDDIKPRDRVRMRSAEREVMASLGLAYASVDA